MTVDGQTDVLTMGLPYICPYNVNSVMNPILQWVSTVGYGFNLYRGRPLVRKGGVLIFTHPLYNRWNRDLEPTVTVRPGQPGPPSSRATI